MRLTLGARLFRLLLVSGLTLSLSRSIDEVAPSLPANTRFFQMALFTYESQGSNWQSTEGYVDVSMFGDDGSPQPAGRSVMRFDSWFEDEPLARAAIDDWSRILAVMIDEPYVTRFQTDHDDDERANPCRGSTAKQETRRANLRAIRTKLLNAVNLVHDVAPRTRVWVNFHEREVRWMRENDCEHLNDPTIDVVSLDHYERNFSELADEYAWFVFAMPQQQLALVPGTHYRIGGDSPSQAAARLQGYFDYANRMNQQCDIGFGRVGLTGNYDGCRVWIVAGWSAIPVFPPPPDPQQFYGILHSSSDSIATVWLNQFSKIRRRTLRDRERLRGRGAALESRTRKSIRSERIDRAGMENQRLIDAPQGYS
jgi:hypothetical protein